MLPTLEAFEAALPGGCLSVNEAWLVYSRLSRAAVMVDMPLPSVDVLGEGERAQRAIVIVIDNGRTKVRSG